MAWSRPPDQAAEDHPAVVPFFAYGTFRPGGASFHRVEDLLAGDPYPARVKGRLVVCSADHWPLLLPGEGTVVGDVLPMLAGVRLWDVLGDWEMAWGYSIRWVPLLPGEEDGSAGRVLACVWEWPDYLGAEIPSGDWFDARR